MVRDSAAYVAVSLVAYGLVFCLMFLLVDVLGAGRSLAFLITYAIAYVFDYFSNLKVVFRREHSRSRLVKYVIYLATFFALANGLFYLAGYLKLHYLLETFLTLATLFPLRFLTLRYVVFRP
ncbi:MAG: GtrA family protein [Archangium sp.]|nr:GtrA family protein [Archangium sp.]